MQEHTTAIRYFLADIDPDTGYLSEPQPYRGRLKPTGSASRPSNEAVWLSYRSRWRLPFCLMAQEDDTASSYGWMGPISSSGSVKSQMRSPSCRGFD